MAVKLSALTRLQPFIFQEDSWYLFLLEAESTPRAIVRLEGLKSVEKFSDFIGN
jgi:hypothetical protein